MKEWLLNYFLKNSVLLIIIALIIVWQRTSDFDDKAFLNRLDFLFYDLKLYVVEKIKNKNEVMEHVVVVDIDDASLQQEGQWPWSRSRVADLVRNLKSMGASVIAFDMLFSESERKSFIQSLRNNQDINPEQTERLIELLSNWNPDLDLSESFLEIDVVLAYLLDQKDNTKVGKLGHKIQEVPNNSVLIYNVGYTTSIEEIQKNAISEGFISTYFDEDGVMRRTPLIMREGNYAYPALSLSAVMSYLLIDEVDIVFHKVGNFETVSEIKVTEKPVHTDAVGRVLIPYKSNEDYVQYVSAKDVLNKTVDESLIGGKIVFVGTSAVTLADLVNTPFGASFPGVGVHAILAENLLKDYFPYRPVESPAAVLMFQVFLSLFMILLLRNQKPLFMVFATLLVSFLLVAAIIMAWIKFELDFPIVSTLILISLIFLWYLVNGFLHEFQQELRIKGMFAQYLPPAHIDQMLNNPEGYSLDGESKELTVLFADIRNFTSISEHLSAIELKRFLNDYLTPITEVIFRHGGTIDKYVGDMVMAFWGAPVDDPKHRQNAIDAALEMKQLILSLSDQFAHQGLPEVKMGIGLNSGLMNVGDMGSEFRKAYTVIGDSVNLGSRLESLTKFYGVTILVGEKCLENQDGYVFRFCDKIKVKGKNQSVKAYEPLGPKETLDEKTLSNVVLYHESIEHYFNCEWEKALAGMVTLHEQEPNRILYLIYIERINKMMTTTVPEGWDGVYVHKSK